MEKLGNLGFDDAWGLGVLSVAGSRDTMAEADVGSSKVAGLRCAGVEHTTWARRASDAPDVYSSYKAVEASARRFRSSNHF